MEMIEAPMDRSSSHRLISRRSSARKSLSSKPSLRLSVQFPKPPRSHLSSSPSSAVGGVTRCHSTMASRSQSSLHARSPVKSVNGKAARSPTTLHPLGPPLSPIPYTKPLPPTPPQATSPPTISPQFVEIPASSLTKELPSPYSPATFSPLLLHLPSSPSTSSTMNPSPTVSCNNKTRVPHLLLNLPTSPDLNIRLSPTTGASTASPSTICSGSDDNDLEEVGGSPISSACEPMTPAKKEEEKSLSFEERLDEMNEANNEEMRATHILSRRVSSLQGDLEKRESEVTQLNLELDALKATAESPQRREATEKLRAQQEVIQFAAGLRRRSTESLSGEKLSGMGQQHLQTQLHQAPIRESWVSGEASAARRHLEQQLDELHIQVRAKDAQIAELENEVYMWKDDVNMLEQSISRLCDDRQHGIHNVRGQDELKSAFDAVERTLAESEAMTAGLKVKKNKEGDSEHNNSSSSSSEEGSPRQCPTCNGRPPVESTDFLKRSKDLEKRIADQVEDIRLYKLDVKGYKKDIRERDSKIRELQHTVLSLQARLGEKEGQVLLSDVPLGIDFGGSSDETSQNQKMPPSRPPPAPPSMTTEGGSSGSSGMLQVEIPSHIIRPQTPEKHQLEPSLSTVSPARLYHSRSTSKTRVVAMSPKFDTITEETPTSSTFPTTIVSQKANYEASSSKREVPSPPIVISGTITTTTATSVGTTSPTNTSPIAPRSDVHGGNTRGTSLPPPPRQIIIPRKSIGGGSGGRQIGGSYSANTSPMSLTHSPTSLYPPPSQQQVHQEQEQEASPKAKGTEDVNGNGNGNSSDIITIEKGNGKVMGEEKGKGKETGKRKKGSMLVRYPTGKDINKGGKWEDPFLY
ncbi:MAG: hypothetical protein M1823_002294 [Watsoniomyces obsoletus]|nr:MAG: hypothetical protein M1823_002294 [Watsoniomyces obsoletus]